jgi:hypothetical protein
VPKRCVPGDWFAVPLPDGTWAAGRVVRKEAWAFLGYYFGPRLRQQPTLADVQHLTAQDAVKVSNSDIYLVTSGICPILGGRNNWDPSDWPVPLFSRNEPQSENYFLCSLPDYQPLTAREKCQPTSLEEYLRFPFVGISFSGAVTNGLNSLLVPLNVDAPQPVVNPLHRDTQLLRFNPRLPPIPHPTNFTLGDWFGVPLPDQTWAVGRVARHRHGVMLCYFFGPRRRRLPNVTVLEKLSAQQAPFIARVGYLALHDGAWRLLGRHESFDPAAWPMPDFGAPAGRKGKYLRVEYEDDDPLEMIVARDSPTNIKEEEFASLPNADLIRPEDLPMKLGQVLPQDQ